jgi:hypothetical protein
MLKRIGVAAVLIVLAARAAVGAGDNPSPRDIIDKAIKAQGGSALEKYKAQTSKFKGTFYGMGEGVPFTGNSASQLPDRLKTEISVEVMGNTFTFTQVVNGPKGWIDMNGAVTEMNKEMLAEARESLNASNASHLVALGDKAYKLSPLGGKKVGDKQTVGVRVQREGFRDVNLFFDKDTGRLLLTETRVKDVQGGGDEELTQETFYGDYKKVEGMELPHKTTIKRDGKPFVESEMTEVKPAEKLDDSIFAKPG